MELYFEPVLPSECAETCRGKILEPKNYNLWKNPLEIPFLKSDLEFLKGYKEEKIINHVFVSKECKSRGNNAEDLFLDIALSKQYVPVIIKDSQTYDYLHHVDLMLQMPNQKECTFRTEVWVDIKSMRSLRRGWKPQSEYMWVELNSGGWLFGGKSTVIAQQIDNNTFALFDRHALKKFVEVNVDVKANVVKNAEESLYRVYLRESKNLSGSVRFTCALSLIKTEEAYSVAGCGIW